VSEPVVRAVSLKRSFETGGRAIEVLRGVDFELNTGSSASIQGESGCGKSTLLHLLGGLDQPSEGSVFWGEKELSNLREDELSVIRGKLIGMVFQSYYLVPELRALDNVMLSGRISGETENLESKSVALLERVGLGDRMDSLPATLSGGERQRVAIARALVSKPKVLLADEPTGNLDETTGDSVMEMLQSLCGEKGVSLVLVTHNAAYAQRMDTSWKLSHGVLQFA